ncbi:hypothetical protein [Tahibacter caeni]|uniref:hypothetical protein n=1 Tax=Tahibacter caeni TaxID=1453545 RepID=UPI002149625E|nr:hypothetical protein [Tahibacter caeni]
MTGYCLDFCSLLNLYCGWGGIQEFSAFGGSWAISDTAFDEFKYVRVQQPDGSLQNTPIDRATVMSQYPLAVLALSGPNEIATFTQLTTEIDDGEAASLTIANHRGLTFVSDDRPALNAAAKLSVPSVSSIHLLMNWATLNPSNAAALPGVVKNIATLASFQPSRNSPYKVWWDGVLSNLSP